MTVIEGEDLLRTEINNDCPINPWSLETMFDNNTVVMTLIL